MLNKKTYWIPLLRPGIETTIPTTRVVLNARPADFVDFQEMADCRAFRLCGRPESRFILVAAGENMGENLFRSSLKQWIARGYAYRNRR